MIKRALKRSYFYYRNGSVLVSLPLTFFGLASAIYYLAMDHIPLLKMMFPSFTRFLIIGGITLFILSVGTGYIYVKRSFFYPTDMQITQEANPFAYRLAPGRDTEFQKATLLNAQFLHRLADRFNLYQSNEERKVWQDYMNKLEFLIEGGDLRKLKKAQT